MEGPGGVQFSGENTYGGITAVVDGTLQITIVTSLPAGGELQVGYRPVQSFGPGGPRMRSAPRRRPASSAWAA